jgi:hypothetical protein
LPPVDCLTDLLFVSASNASYLYAKPRNRRQADLDTAAPVENKRTFRAIGAFVRAGRDDSPFQDDCGEDMKRRTSGLIAALIFLLVPVAQAQQAPPPAKALSPGNVLSALGGGSVDALAGSLRGFLLKSLPAPLYEDTRHWDLQKPVNEVKWRGKGIHVHPEKIEVMKNDGRWWKVRVTGDRLPDTLIFDLRDAQQSEPGRMTFTAFISFDTHIEYDKQIWHSGKRTYSSSIRARLRVRLTLHCEATARLDDGGGLLPDAVFRLRVLQAESGFDNVVVEHIAGLGGEAAKLLGDAARGSLKQWRPSMEHELLAKANAAIVKAADTKEVRVSLSKLLTKKN